MESMISSACGVIASMIWEFIDRKIGFGVYLDMHKTRVASFERIIVGFSIT